jgi:hypothetical protein
MTALRYHSGSVGMAAGMVMRGVGCGLMRVSVTRVSFSLSRKERGPKAYTKYSKSDSVRDHRRTANTCAGKEPGSNPTTA